MACNSNDSHFAIIRQVFLYSFCVNYDMLIAANVTHVNGILHHSKAII
jgi:hypothetical protein